MGDTYIEYMVKRKTPFYLIIAKWLLIIFDATIIAASLLLGTLGVIPMIIGVIIGIGIYFLVRRWDLEFEYIYQNGELVIDKIMSKAARKRACTIDLQSMEMMFKGTDHAEARAYRDLKVKNFTTGCNKDNIYTIVICGTTNYKIYFEPNQEIIEAIRLMAPRKVLIDRYGF